MTENPPEEISRLVDIIDEHIRVHGWDEQDLRDQNPGVLAEFLVGRNRLHSDDVSKMLTAVEWRQAISHLRDDHV